MPKTLDHKEQSPAWVVFLAIAGLALLPTLGCFTAPPFPLDDGVLVFNNPYVTGQASWASAFTRFHYHQYIPLTLTSFRLNAEVFGLDATWSFRLINGLLHACSAFVLWRLLRHLGLGARGALFVACAWAAHPLGCETVAWVSERSNALSFLFGSLALWAYIAWHREWKGVLWATLAFAAALLSKPLALGWLPVFIGIELLGGPARLAAKTGDTQKKEGPVAADAGSWKQHFRVAAIRLLPLVAMAMASMSIGFLSYAVADRPPPGGSWFTALLTDSNLFLRYLWNTLVPLQLSAMYAIRHIASLADPRLWLNVLIWVVLIAGSLLLARSRRRVALGWLWFLGGLGPASNVVAIGYPMQDRYIYLSSVGVLLILVETVAGLAERAKTHSVIRHPRSGAIAGALYVVFLGLLTLQRAPLWGDSFALMQQAVRRQPDGALPHVFFALELERKALALETETPRNPARAQALRAEAAGYLTTAIQQPDLYVFDPIPARIRLARNWVLSGHPDKAVSVLESLLPALQDYEVITRGGKRYLMVPKGPGDRTYALSMLTIAQGHYWLGEACLALALKESAPGSKTMLRRVQAESRRALTINPALYEAYALQAKAFLVRDGKPEKPSAEGMQTARGRVAVSTPCLQQMASIPEVLAALRPPVSDERVQALACLAMARAAFEAAEKAAQEDSVKCFKSSLDWLQRALAFDPSFGEAAWFKARVHHTLAKKLETTTPQAAAQQRAESVKALSMIDRESPRYLQAQKGLKALQSKP